MIVEVQIMFRKEMVVECQLLSIIDADHNMQYVSLAESFLTVNKKDWNSDIRMKRETMMFSKTLRRPDQEFSVTATSVYLA